MKDAQNNAFVKKQKEFVMKIPPYRPCLIKKKLCVYEFSCSIASKVCITIVSIRDDSGQLWLLVEKHFNLFICFPLANHGLRHSGLEDNWICNKRINEWHSIKQHLNEIFFFIFFYFWQLGIYMSFPNLYDASKHGYFYLFKSHILLRKYRRSLFIS